VKPKTPTIQQQYETKLAALRAAIDEGDASGIAKGDVFARVRKTLGLPARPRRQRL
jgi:antitoxin ParD1/3/4